jgi:hypothetical protein
MTQFNRTYTLDSEGLRGAIEVLKRAESLGLTGRERIGYHVLIKSVDIGIIGLVWIFICFILGSLFPLHISTTTLLWLVALGVLLLFVSAVGGIGSMMFNILLFRKAWYEQAELKKLGLTNLSKSLWKAGRKHRWLHRGRGPILILISTVQLLIAVPFFLSVGFLGLNEAMGWALSVAIALFLILCALTILGAQYLRNWREQIELVSNAGKLQDALRELQNHTGDHAAVMVPSNIMEQVTRIESSQIAQERKMAILESAGSERSGYAVRFTPEAAEQKSALDMAHRIKLEDLLEQLSTGLLHGEANVRGAGEISQARITNAPVEIEYSTDKPGHQIRVVAVRQIGEEADRIPGSEEQRHA